MTKIVIEKPTCIHLAKLGIKRLYSAIISLLKLHIETCCDLFTYLWQLNDNSKKYKKSFPKTLTLKLRKSSFWPQKLGVDFYMGSTNAPVNTVLNVCLWRIPTVYECTSGGSVACVFLIIIEHGPLTTTLKFHSAVLNNYCQIWKQPL